MDKESDSERLRRLGERIDRARGEEKAAASKGDISQANVAWQMVTELVAGIVIGLGIGLGLDALLGTRPLMLVLFILLGFVAGVRVMMRTAAEVQRKQAARTAEDERD